MTARVNSPRAADQLRREYNVLGDRINLQLDDVVVPVAIISDLTAGSGGVPLVRRAYATFYQAAVALEYATWRIEIPSGFIGVINRLVLRTTAAAFCRARWGSTIVAPANIAVAMYMDGRLRQDGFAPAATLAFGTQVAPLAAGYRYIEGSNTPGVENVVEWPFGRDDGLVDFIEFQAPLVNQEMTVSMEWDEIPLI